MKRSEPYRQTQIACYLGFITQAIAANFAPLLFLTFRRSFSITLAQIALIPTCFFITQLIVDLICACVMDRIGYRTGIIAAEVLSGAGLLCLAFLPSLFPSPFPGILVSVVIYAIGSGLIEVLCSPIIEACPFENKEGVMSLLHSFYCWGSVGVILLSTIFFALFGTDHWRILCCIWSVVPLANIRNFAVCPMEPLIREGSGMTIPELMKKGVFWVLILLMICAGSSELAMAQWSSAFAESALHIPKSVGDLVGPCGFAVAMGLSRVLYAKYSEKVDLSVFMIFSGLLCLGCYLLASLASLPVLNLIGCIVCGFSVGIMWPGSISISSVSLPRGGTAMFALLALAGDLGGALGPWIVGNVSQSAGENLQAGVLAGIGFPAILAAAVLFLRYRAKKLRPDAASGCPEDLS